MMTRSMRLHEAAGRGDVKAIRTIASFGFDLTPRIYGLPGPSTVLLGRER